MQFQLTEKDFNKYAIYRLWRNRPNSDAPWTLIYVGSLPVTQLMTLRDARDYSNYSDYVKADDLTLIEIVNVAATPESARNAADEHAKDNQAVLNTLGKLRPINHTRRKRPIIDTATGTRYESAAEACEKLGIASSSMSNHLRGKKHHGTAGGKIFHYADTEETQ